MINSGSHGVGCGSRFCFLLFGCWRCLTFPHASACSIISAVGLSFRVRDGSGRFPRCCGHQQVFFCFVVWFVLCGILWSGRGFCCLCCWFWCISTSYLLTLQWLQFWPIDPVFFWAPLVKLYLKRGFPLRCFQRLSCPYVAIQLCHWRDNWWTRGTSVPVLSY